MECGEQYVEWIIVMLLSSVVLLDLMEVYIPSQSGLEALLCINTLYLLQCWSTIALTICLEMVGVQFFITFDAVDVNQTLEHATNIHILAALLSIAVEGQSVE